MNTDKKYIEHLECSNREKNELLVKAFFALTNKIPAEKKLEKIIAFKDAMGISLRQAREIGDNAQIAVTESNKRWAEVAHLV